MWSLYIFNDFQPPTLRAFWLSGHINDIYDWFLANHVYIWPLDQIPLGTKEAASHYPSHKWHNSLRPLCIILFLWKLNVVGFISVFRSNPVDVSSGIVNHYLIWSDTLWPTLYRRLLQVICGDAAIDPDKDKYIIRTNGGILCWRLIASFGLCELKVTAHAISITPISRLNSIR